MEHNRKFREAAVKGTLGILFNSGLNSFDPVERRMMKKLLKEPVWCYTGTFDTGSKVLHCPLWSQAVYNRWTINPKAWVNGVEFEHVVRISTIIERLILADNESEVRVVLANTPTCAVTREEHEQLMKRDRVSGLDGWNRYIDLDIRTVDNLLLKITN